MLSALTRGLTRAGSATALLAFTVGIPTGLLHYLGNPLPSQVPTLRSLQALLSSPISDQLLVHAVAALVWLLWLLLVASVLVEIVAAARGVTAPRPRLLRPTQGLAAALVAGLTAGLFAPAAIAPLSPAVGGPTQPQMVVISTADAAAIPLRPAAHITTTAPAAGHVTLVISGCGYTHKVIKGDTLWHIAKLCLGDPQRWPQIWQMNKGKHWPRVSGRTAFHNPDLIFPGWVLLLPDDATPPPGAQPLPGGTITPPSTATPSTSPLPSASASPTLTASPSAPASSAPATTPTPTPASPDPAGASPTATTDATDTANQQRPAGDGIEIPGGWLTAGLGAALLFAIAIVWRRRRHRYVPTPITAAILDDADLAPPLAARTLIRRKLRRAAPTADPDEPAPDTGPTVREYVQAERAGVQVMPELPPIGPTGPQLVGLDVVAATGGLGLDGDGALDAARAVLVATLSAGHSGDPDARGRAVVPAATLASLIGVSAVDLGPMDRLIIADTFADAVAYIEEEIIRRSRIIADVQVADVAALRAEHAFAEPLPQLLLVAEAPEPVWSNRTATALGLGGRVDIVAVFIGAWSTTMTVAADGTTSGGDGHRMAVLDADSAVEAIAMLREAHTETEPRWADTAVRDHPLAASGGQPPPKRSAHQPPLPDGDGDRDADAGEPITARHPAAADKTRPASAATDDPDTSRVQVRVLGFPAVIDAAGQPAPKLRAKSRELLVYLAVNRSGRALHEIMEALWPEAHMSRAKQRLANNVGNLRSVIRAVAATTMNLPDDTDDEPDRPKLEPVINTGGFYRLDPAIVSVDWWTVLDEYAQVATAPDDQHRLKHLLAAIAKLGGPLAEDTDYDWIDTDRERVRRHQIKLLAQAADLLADDDPHTSRQLLDDACRIDPLCDELARRAMRAAATLGDVDGIRHRLDTLRQALDDADLDLDAETEQLAATLLHDLHRHET